MSRFQKCSSSSNLKHKLCTLLQTAHRSPREQDENRPQDSSSPSQRKPSKEHQELTHSMYPLWNQALRHEEYTKTANKELPGSRGSWTYCPISKCDQLRKPLKHRRCGIDFRIRETLLVENIEKPSKSTQALTQTMYPLSNQAPSPWPSADEPRGPPYCMASL